MKVKVKESDLKNSYCKIISIGYCGAQYLLRYVEPYYYTCGVYGWKSDNYVVNGVLISTGYAPINGLRNYELVKKYEAKAEKINLSSTLEWEEKKKKTNKLLEKLINEFMGAE